MRWMGLGMSLALVGCGGGKDTSSCGDGDTCAGTPTGSTSTGTTPGVPTGTPSGVTGGTPTGTPTGGTTTATAGWIGTPGPDCPTLIGTVPAMGEVDVFIGTTVRFDTNPVPPTSVIELYDPAGTAIPGVSTLDGAGVSFVPDQPLAASTVHQAHLIACGATAFFTFTTSDVGSGPVDPYTLVGQTLELDPASGVLVQPAGIAGLAGAFVSDERLYGVVGATASTLDVVTAIGDGLGNQDLCVPTGPPITLTVSGNGEVAGSEGAGVAYEPSVGVQTTYSSRAMTGVLNPAGDLLQGGTVLVEQVDMRPLEALVGSDPCALLAAFGVVCAPCPDGELQCLDVEGVDYEATAGVGPVVERSEADVLNDPNCP